MEGGVWTCSANNGRVSFVITPPGAPAVFSDGATFKFSTLNTAETNRYEIGYGSIDVTGP